MAGFSFDLCTREAEQKRIAALEAQNRELLNVAWLARALIVRLRITGANHDAPKADDWIELGLTDAALYNLDTALRSVPQEEEVPDGAQTEG